MQEKSELVPSHPWFGELSESLSQNFEGLCRHSITRALSNEDGPQKFAQMFGPFTPSLFDGILEPAQIQEITNLTPTQHPNLEQAIGYFIQLTRGIAQGWARSLEKESPPDDVFDNLEQTIQAAIPTQTGTELIVLPPERQTIEPAPSRREELKSSEAYFGVTDAVLQSENLQIEERNGIQGVEIEAGGEQHFVPLEHLWTLIDYSPIASNGIQEEPFQKDFRRNKISTETEEKLNAVDDVPKEKRLREEWTDFILGIRQEQLRAEVANLRDVQPRLDEERQVLEQLTLQELRDQVIELYPQSPLVDMAEKEQIDRAYQTASEKLKFHQVTDKILASEHYDDMVVGMANAERRTGRKIVENLRPEEKKIDPEQPDPIPIYAELQPVVEEFYQAICRALYQEVLIAHYPATPAELSRVKTIFQQALNETFLGLADPSFNFFGTEYEQKSSLNKISLAFGRLMRQMLSGINNFQEIEPAINAIISEQLKLAIEKKQLTLRSHDGRKIHVDNIHLPENAASGKSLLRHQLADELLPAIVYAQAVGDSLHDETLTQSTEAWQNHWLDALDLPTASLRGVERDVPYSKNFRTLTQTRQDVAEVYGSAEKDLPEIRKKREIRLKVDEARRQIEQARSEIEKLLSRVEELRAEAQKRYSEAQQATAEALKKQKETPIRQGLLGGIKNQAELTQVNNAYMAAQAAENDAELNLRLVFQSKGVAEGPIRQIAALRDRIHQAQVLIQQQDFPPTPSLDIDFEPEVDIDLTENEV